MPSDKPRDGFAKAEQVCADESILKSLSPTGCILELNATARVTSPSWGQRLALALVSLILWVIVFFVVILIITTTPAQIITPTGPIDNSKGLYTIAILLSLGLLILSTIVLAINILFNRRH